MGAPLREKSDISKSTRGRGESGIFSMNSVVTKEASNQSFDAADKPLVSVVIPVYNRGALIEKTVQSALDQTLAASDVEILIVDDGSTDETYAILQRLYSSHGQVRPFQIPNGGVARARNFGLEQARGEFIAFLDHDDIWLPQKLRLQLERMKNDEKIGVVYSSWVSVDASGQEMPPIIQFQRQWWWRPRNGCAYPWTLLPHPLQFVRNPIVSMSVPLIRTQLLRDVGGFDARTVPSDDWDLWIRLSKICDFACVNQELVRYVHHEGQQHKQMKTAYASALVILRKHRAPWNRRPWLRFKQQAYRRTCYALTYHAQAEIAAEHKKLGRLIWLAVKATIQRPETPLMRRWHRLFVQALAR